MDVLLLLLAGVLVWSLLMLGCQAGSALSDVMDSRRP
jgi:hypothetical protein